MQLRVLSVNDAREWRLPLRDAQQQIQVAELKRLVLQQQQLAASDLSGSGQNAAQQHKLGAREEESKSENDGDDDDDDGGGDSYILFRGRILADMDFFNLNALSASDFFVIAQEEQEQDDDDERAQAHEYEQVQQAQENADAEPERKRHKRDRDDAASAVATTCGYDAAKAQQLVEMGFSEARVRLALQHAGDDLARAIALLTGDESVPAMASSGDAAGDRVHELVRKHPTLQVLQPVLSELQQLSVQQVAAADVFQALLLLKENVSSESLAQLNANPSAAVQFFRLDPQSVAPASAVDGRRRGQSSEQAESVVIDLVDDMAGQNERRRDGNGDSGGGSMDEEAITRLTSMGFDRDLVVAMYDSCGRQEEAALNALCEMLA